jgi:hypothetical protein
MGKKVKVGEIGADQGADASGDVGGLRSWMSLDEERA